MTTPARCFPISLRIGDERLAHISLRQRQGEVLGAHDYRSPAKGPPPGDPVFEVAGVTGQLDAVSWSDFAAREWLLWLRNNATEQSPIVSDVLPLDLTLPASDWRLHRTRGSDCTAHDFAWHSVPLRPGEQQSLSAGGGRSSNRDFPFFTLETARRTLVFAVGWSGQWSATFACLDNGDLHVTAGQTRTHFRLAPGECVRMPRILVLEFPGDADDAHAAFRQLIYRHYVARRGDGPPLPTPFCNTCFTRGGTWLNECNADNQMTLIDAYSHLGVEALITDAGWFEGGWPAGAGNWTPRRDAYPEGIEPVAEAAAQRDMCYGLWFEPERVVVQSELHRLHPDWLLDAPDGTPNTLLADFGKPAVRDYFHTIVARFMRMPGFGVYRQDFNMDPLPYWQHADTAESVGLTEIRYIMGLYAFWQGLAEAWPDGLRDNCASGGRRIDLETIMHMHLHQRSDYWFDDAAEQASLWSLNRYLPSNIITAPLNRLDATSFHSVLPSSICFGWIADDPAFDEVTARRRLTLYRAVRHLLVGACYPLTPWDANAETWLGMQYHRPDLDEGLVLIFRRKAPESDRTIHLRALTADRHYHILDMETDERTTHAGATLHAGFKLTISTASGSRVLRYSAV